MRTGEPARLSYWHSGGAIAGRREALSPARALALLRFHGRAAMACERLGDRAGARHCARIGVELAVALLRQSDWKRAAG